MEYDSLHVTPWTHGTFWVLVAVVIFAVLAARKLWAAIAGMLDARTRHIRETLAEAAQLKEEAEAMLAEAQARQAQAAADAKMILQTAHEEAARLAAELAGEAEATAARRERMALERIAAAEAQALKEVRAIAVDVATAASVRMLRENFGASADAALLDHAIQALPTALRA